LPDIEQLVVPFDNITPEFGVEAATITETILSPNSSVTADIVLVKFSTTVISPKFVLIGEKVIGIYLPWPLYFL
jgi:hypothetical protein